MLLRSVRCWAANDTSDQGPGGRKRSCATEPTEPQQGLEYAHGDGEKAEVRVIGGRATSQGERHTGPYRGNS